MAGVIASVSLKTFKQMGFTVAGVAILLQIISNTAIALVGAIDVGTLLAAGIVLTLINICKLDTNGDEENSNYGIILADIN